MTNPKSRQSLTYGEITRGEKLTQIVSSDPPLTPPSDWKIAGSAHPKADGRDFVTGKHQYPSDIMRPGMMFGKVLRPAGFNATLVSLDTSTAEKMSAIHVVHDGNFVGVVAEDVSIAEQALSATQAKWNVPAQVSNKELFDYLRNNPDPKGGGPQRASWVRSSCDGRRRCEAGTTLYSPSVIHKALGSEAPTRTPTVYCDSTFLGRVTYPVIPKPI